MKKLLIFVFTLSMVFCLSSCLMPCEGAEHYDDAMSYFFEHNHMIVFPPTLENAQEVVEFHYYEYEHKGRKKAFEFYLSVIFDEENFEKEINRLKSLFAGNGNSYGKVPIYFDTKHFNYPAYLTIYNKKPYTYENKIYEQHKFEYALVDYECKNVIYVSLDHVLYEDVSFDKKYLPKDYSNKQDDFYFEMYDMFLEDYNEFIASQSDK